MGGGFSVTVDDGSCTSVGTKEWNAIRKVGCSLCDPELNGWKSSCWDKDHDYDWFACEEIVTTTTTTETPASPCPPATGTTAPNLAGEQVSSVPIDDGVVVSTLRRAVAKQLASPLSNIKLVAGTQVLQDTDCLTAVV